MRFITLHSFSLRLPSGSPFASPLRLPLSRALLTFAFDNIFISLLFSRPRCFHCNLINIAANSIHFRAPSPSPSPSYSLTYAFPRIFLAVSQPAMFRCIGRCGLDGPRQIFLRDSQNRYFYTGSSRGISRTRDRNGDTLSFVPVDRVVRFLGDRASSSVGGNFFLFFLRVHRPTAPSRPTLSLSLSFSL